jgi:hypothetical protein
MTRPGDPPAGSRHLSLLEVRRGMQRRLGGPWWPVLDGVARGGTCVVWPAGVFPGPSISPFDRGGRIQVEFVEDEGGIRNSSKWRRSQSRH